MAGEASTLNRLWSSAGQRLRVRSALNPILWLCAIGTPICLFAASSFRDVTAIRDACLVVGLAPIAVACLAFIGFALWRPEKLQSEDYQLRHESLQLIQQKTGQIAVDPASIEAIANPAVGSAIEYGGEAR